MSGFASFPLKAKTRRKKFDFLDRLFVRHPIPFFVGHRPNLLQGLPNIIVARQFSKVLANHRQDSTARIAAIVAALI